MAACFGRPASSTLNSPITGTPPRRRLIGEYFSLSISMSSKSSIEILPAKMSAGVGGGDLRWLEIDARAIRVLGEACGVFASGLTVESGLMAETVLGQRKSIIARGFGSPSESTSSSSVVSPSLS